MRPLLILKLVRSLMPAAAMVNANTDMAAAVAGTVPGKTLKQGFHDLILGLGVRLAPATVGRGDPLQPAAVPGDCRAFTALDLGRDVVERPAEGRADQ
jgi:hypothetical protein